MPIIDSNLLIHPWLWKLTGFMSSIVGFVCYALSPSFQGLIGKWNPLKMVIYIVVSSLLSVLMLLVKRCSWGCVRSFLLKAHAGFLVLAITTLYSYLEDQSEEGKEEKVFGRVMNLTSTGAFALMALSLSRQLELGFEVGIFNFFIGCFLVTVVKMNWKLAPLAALFCYLLINIRSISDFLLEKRGRDAGNIVRKRDMDVEALADRFESDSRLLLDRIDMDLEALADPFESDRGLLLDRIANADIDNADFDVLVDRFVSDRIANANADGGTR